jgi:osmotically-inducible protein OsmY
MNGKQRAQWNESRRQPWPEHSDTEIAKRARSVLRWKIRYDSIQVTAEKGHLTLFGEVNWNLDREAAEQTVRKLRRDWSHQSAYGQRLCRRIYFFPRRHLEATKDVEDL